LIINNWTDHALTENSGTITLVAGQKYDIRIEFYYNVSLRQPYIDARKFTHFSF